MADSLHQVHIECDPKTLYLALTQEEGIRSWLTPLCTMATSEGEPCHLTLDNGNTEVTLVAQKQLPFQRVFCRCTNGPAEWLETELWWEITQAEDAGCLLDFKHMNWKKDEGIFPHYNSMWGSALLKLKQYCELGVVDPLFEQSQPHALSS